MSLWRQRQEVSWSVVRSPSSSALKAEGVHAGVDGARAQQSLALASEAKYNRLLRIEELLGASAIYPGMDAFRF